MIMCATPLKKMASCVCVYVSDGSGTTREIQVLSFGCAMEKWVLNGKLNKAFLNFLSYLMGFQS